MSAQAIRAGKAFVEVSIRDKLTQGLRSAWGKLKAFASMVKATFLAITGTLAAVGLAIAAVAGPLVMVTKHFANVGSDLHDMAGRTGVAVEALSAMKYAAEQTGASLSDVEMALRTMARKGIPVEKFEELGKAIAAMTDPSEQAAAAMQLWGKSGTRLLPMFREWVALRSRAEKLGLVVTKEDAEKADKLGDTFADLGATWDALKFKTGAAWAVPMTNVLEQLTVVLVDLGNAMTAFSLKANFATVQLAEFVKGVADGLAIASLFTGIFGIPEAANFRAMGKAARKSIVSLGTSEGGSEPGSYESYKQAVSSLGSSFGTFSSPGSNLAGRAGKGLKREDAIGAKMLAELQKHGITLGKIQGGVEDIDALAFD